MKKARQLFISLVALAALAAISWLLPPGHEPGVRPARATHGTIDTVAIDLGTFDVTSRDTRLLHGTLTTGVPVACTPTPTAVRS